MASSTSPQRHVLISGAGIAGLVLAHWLLKAHWRVTVVEKADEIRLGGQSIDIRQSAVDIVRWMGLEPTVKAKCNDLSGFAFLSADGKTIGSIESSGSAEKQSLVSEYEIYRDDLARIFYEDVRAHPDITFIWSDTVTSISQSPPSPVKVTFTTHSPATYDLVVGADGLGSKIRSMILSPSEIEFRSFGAFGTFFTVPEDFAENDKGIGKQLSLPGGRAIFMQPNEGGGTRGGFWVSADEKSDPARFAAYRKAVRGPREQCKQAMFDAFPEETWVVPALKQAMLRADDFYGTEFAQVRTPTIHSGQVVLLGDAGYCPSPLTGMGTSLAIIGAYILAGELAKGGEVEGALDEFERIMLPFAKSVQNSPTWLAKVLTPQTEWGLMARNALIITVSYVARSRFASAMSVVMGWAASRFPAFQKASFAPPKYEWATA